MFIVCISIVVDDIKAFCCSVSKSFRCWCWGAYASGILHMNRIKQKDCFYLHHSCSVNSKRNWQMFVVICLVTEPHQLKLLFQKMLSVDWIVIKVRETNSLNNTLPALLYQNVSQNVPESTNALISHESDNENIFN